MGRSQLTRAGVPAVRVEAAQRRKLVVDMLVAGASRAEVAKALGVSATRVTQLFQQALARAENESVAEYRAIQLEKLAALQAKLLKIINTKHIAYSQGRVMRPQRWRPDDPSNPTGSGKWVDDPDAEPYEDTAPVVAAINAYRQLLEREAKLTGADAPARMEVAAAVAISINGVDTAQVV